MISIKGRDISDKVTPYSYLKIAGYNENDRYVEKDFLLKDLTKEELSGIAGFLDAVFDGENFWSINGVSLRDIDDEKD